MQMTSKISLIKSKLKDILKDPKIIDILVFGSTIKGKANPNDLDIAIITEKPFKKEIKGVHLSVIKPRDFFIKPPSLTHTLLREGYSLKNNKPLSEYYKFNNKVLFFYELKGLNPSKKVKVVNFLKGKQKKGGLVKEKNGKWIANQVFIVPIGNENIFEKFFLNLKVKFKKSYVLIH